MYRDVQRQMDRWVSEQVFEEDVRAMMQWLRPNRRERLLGWEEMRTGGATFRATVSWDPQAPGADDDLTVPCVTDVLESILIGSAKNQDELDARQEFELYRKVVLELLRRIDDMQSRYE
jgi:hypothetical protein